MKIAIIGIGGIGGFVGAKLAEFCKNNAKHSVSFIQRGIHGKVIFEKGLKFIGKQEQIVFPTAVYINQSIPEIFDVIILAVKSKDLEKTVRDILPNSHKNTVFITLLNGVNNAQRIQQIVPNYRVLQGCIYVSAAITEPGTVSQKGGAGAIYVGPENGDILEIDRAIVEVFVAAGLKVDLSTNITKEVWKKYMFISAFAALTSALDLRMGEVIRSVEHSNLVTSVFNELLQLAQAKQVDITHVEIETSKELALKIPVDTPTSMQLDIEAGKNCEVDVLVQYVINESEKLSLETPAYFQLNMLIHKRING